MTTTNQTDAQMKLADVTQADREAAADFFECSTFAGRDAFLRGDEERRQSEALGYRMILRGPQLLEAMGRSVG